MKKTYPIPLALAASLTMVGCMSVQPSNFATLADAALKAEASKSCLTNLTIRFAPSKDYKTQTYGTYSTEIRLMYTEAVVRSDGYDYHIGVKANTDNKSLTLNDQGAADLTPGSTRTCGVAQPYVYAGIPGLDDPLFQQLSATATGSATLANMATDSHQVGSYILSAGIFRDNLEIANPSTDPSRDLLWYDDPYNLIATGSEGIATFSARTDAGVLRTRPAIDSVENALKSIFVGTSVITNAAGGKTATASINPTITAGAAPYILAKTVPLKNKTGAAIAPKAMYFKIVLPSSGDRIGQLKEVRLPALPLGRLVVDVRKYSSAGVASSYSYGYFMLMPTGNTLDVGDLNNCITTETKPTMTF